MSGELTGNDGLPLTSLMRLRDAVGAFRALQPGIPTSYVDMFLAVALRPGLGPSEYASMVGTIQPMASRTLMEIGGHSRVRDTPLHLVSSQPHPESRRQVQYLLTPKGYALAHRVGWMLKGR